MKPILYILLGLALGASAVFTPEPTEVHNLCIGHMLIGGLTCDSNNKKLD